MVRIMAWVFLLLLAVAIGAVVYLGAGPAAPSDTHTVTKDKIRRVVHGAGRVEGAPEITLSFGRAGRLEKVEVKEGQEVVLNDTLAELNPAEVRKQIEQAQAALKEAQAALDVANTPPQPEAIRQVEEKYEQAKATVKGAEVKLKALENPPPPPPAEKWQLDDADRTIKDAQSQLDLAELELKKLKAGPPADDVAVAQAKLDAAAAERDGARKRLEQFKAGVPLPLFGSTPRETKADLEVALQRAEEAVKVAQAEFDRVRRGPTPDDVKAAELKVEMKKTALESAKAARERLANPPPARPALPSDIEQAKLALQQAQAGERLGKAALDEAKRGPDDAKIRAAKASVEKKNAELSLLNLHLEGLTLRAPGDGLVTRRHVEPGATVQAFVPIISIVDFSRKRVRAEYDVSRMGDLKPGMPVSISSRAFGKELADGKSKETLEGKVLELGHIGPRKIFAEDPAAHKGGEVVEVVIGVEEPKGEAKKKVFDDVLRLGLPVETEVVLEERLNVLAVPKSYVSQEDGKEYILRVDRDAASGKDEAPKRRYIKCGSRDDHYVEVIEGLNDGDKIMKPKAKNGK